MTEFEQVLSQYEPMISATLRQLNIYKEHGQFRQAARIALWQAWTRYDESKGHFAPYASRSMRGAMLELLQRENKFETHCVQTEDDVLALMIDQQVEGITGHYLSDSIVQAIEALSNNEKELIQWLYFEQFTQVECAKRAGISVAGIKKRRERMLVKLRSLLEQQKACEQ